MCGESALACVHVRDDKGVFCSASLFASLYLLYGISPPPLCPHTHLAAIRAIMMRDSVTIRRPAGILGAMLQRGPLKPVAILQINVERDRPPDEHKCVDFGTPTCADGHQKIGVTSSG